MDSLETMSWEQMRDGDWVYDIVLEKPRFGAFHGTDLELILRARGVDSVILTGIATNVCVETTAAKPQSATFACSSRVMAPPRPT